MTGDVKKRRRNIKRRIGNLKMTRRKDSKLQKKRQQKKKNVQNKKLFQKSTHLKILLLLRPMLQLDRPTQAQLILKMNNQ